jgi:hypothetical protein
MRFRGARAVGFVARHGLLALAACSSSSSPTVQADAGGTDSATADSSNGGPGDGGTDAGASFAGTWTCTGTQTLTFMTPTGLPPMMTAGSYMLVISTTGAGLSETVNGCMFTFTVSGDVATGAPTGQMCASGSLLQNNPKGSSDSTYSMGTLTLTSPTTMTSSGSFTFTDSAILGDGGKELYAGTGTYMSTCTKQ